MNTNLSSLSALVGRALIAWLFVPAGFAKLTGLAGAMAYTASGGLPGWLAIPALAVELLGGLAILVGWQTRWAALALAAFTVVAGIVYHYIPAQSATDAMVAMGQMINFNKNLAISGGLLLLAAFGAGAWSLDARQGRVPAYA
jgi:putative oxidoreductase